MSDESTELAKDLVGNRPFRAAAWNALARGVQRKRAERFERFSERVARYLDLDDDFSINDWVWSEC